MTRTSEINLMDPTLNFADALDWVRRNTNFPSFEDFARNPDKWRTNKEDIFDMIEKMNVFFKDRLKETTILWRGKYKVESASELQRIAKEDGFDGSELEVEPIVERLDGMSNHHLTSVQVTINVWPKIEFKLRGGIVANE